MPNAHDSPPRARHWEGPREADAHWWPFVNRTLDKQPVAARASVTPGVAEAGQPDVWRVSVVLEDEPLRQGAHLTMEVPSYWQLDLGRPVRVHPTVLHLAPAGSVTPGYGCEVRVDLPEGIGHDLAVSYASYSHIIDIAITSGELPPGEELVVWLGSHEGSKLRAQTHAQKAVFFTFVDADGDGDYRPLSAFPTVEVIGSHARALRLVIPSAIEPGEPFGAHLTAMDLKGMNPASGYSGQVEIRDEQGESLVAGRIRFDGQKRAVGRFRVPPQKVDGVLFLTAVDRGNAMMCRSNPCLVGGDRVYFGDLHGQNYVGQGTGDMDEYYRWARDVECLDFCAWAGYEYRTPLDGDKWRRRVLEVANRHHEDGKFVVLQAFEFSGHGGHRNVYTPGDDLPLHGAPLGRAAADTEIALGERVPSGARPERLWQALEGAEAITIPHHPKFLGGQDWSYRNDAMQPVVEICSQWGVSEEGGPRSVQTALLMGHRFGFIGGTDTHKGQPGHGPHGLDEGNGLAGVYAADLARRGIFDAIVARRCYATDGARILLDYELTVGERTLKMGQEGALSEGPRRLSIRVAACETVARVEVLRNCEVVHTLTPGGRSARLKWVDTDDLTAHLIRETPFGDRPFAFYYIRVTQEDGRRAWGSPIWLNP
jgi:hypothetical protein